MKNEAGIAKPLTLLREDFINNVVDLCNNSNLPYFIIENVLRDVISEIHLAGKQQLENDRAKYNEAISKLGSK